MTDARTTPDVDIAARIDGARRAVEALHAQQATLDAIGRAVVDALAAGGTIYTCGNGGSSAQALHLAEELIGRYRADRPARRAICLNADVTALTCIANDYGYDAVFARQCEALLTERDVLVVFTTSGRSPNVLRAMEIARTRGTTTIGLLGRDGGPAKALSDLALVAAGDESAFIQDAHQVVLHLICEYVETMP